MLIGYARVSVADQNLDLQIDALQAAGCDPKRIYQDVISGASTYRPGLESALTALREGDTLVVWRLDRLGRSLSHLVNTVESLQQQDIGFKSLTECIDTSTSIGKLFLGIFGSLAEFERNLIRERTAAGLAAARARGRNGGRPRKHNQKKIELASEMATGDHTVAEVCESLGISRGTYYRRLKEK